MEKIVRMYIMWSCLINNPYEIYRNGNGKMEIDRLSFVNQNLTEGAEKFDYITNGRHTL